MLEAYSANINNLEVANDLAHNIISETLKQRNAKNY